MMKAIMISIKPKWVKEILNGEKTIEIRKKFPKDYVGWVYIYNTKATKDGVLKLAYIGNKLEFVLSYDKTSKYQGKVVARFWCDKVEDYVNGRKWSWKSGAPMWGACNDYEYILKDTCLTEDELYDYCEDLSFKAIHITKLEIFDKPKEISEFEREIGRDENVIAYGRLTCAPQSWCYVEE